MQKHGVRKMGMALTAAMMLMVSGGTVSASGGSCECNDVHNVQTAYGAVYTTCQGTASGDLQLITDLEVFGFTLPAIQARFNANGGSGGQNACLVDYEYAASHNACNTQGEDSCRKCNDSGTYNIRHYDGGGCSNPWIGTCKPVARNPADDNVGVNKNSATCPSCPCA